MLSEECRLREVRHLPELELWSITGFLISSPQLLFSILFWVKYTCKFYDTSKNIRVRLKLWIQRRSHVRMRAEIILIVLPASPLQIWAAKMILWNITLIISLLWHKYLQSLLPQNKNQSPYHVLWSSILSPPRLLLPTLNFIFFSSPPSFHRATVAFLWSSKHTLPPQDPQIFCFFRLKCS